ncbi:DivIVA domain-containing protein [Streptomyces sp. L2]|uniref:DivIVA domain-containing protein n=1 Tax=Streptomyces sp. L2 TaxID=2162665 RepID=UPI001012EF03|nr:DivIVA domain-containing protein [Streptomyces sp. L2]
MPLSPEDVRNKQFTTVRLREGYDEDEVDAFLDKVEAELTRLVRENKELRAKLAAATPPAAQKQPDEAKPPEPKQQPDPHGPSALGPVGLASELPSGIPSAAVVPGGQGGPHGQGPFGGPMGGPGQGPGGDSAARVLSLAQQTADQAIAEARSEANRIVGEARGRAEGLERDARARADALERDAREKHRAAIGSLESARATLERKVEDLRGFEREYRSRLKSYLESQLRHLETSQADDAVTTSPPMPLPPAAPAPPMPPAGTSPSSYGGQQMPPSMHQAVVQGPSAMGHASPGRRGFLLDDDDN